MLFQRQFKELADDHNSLLSATVRILENLEDLRMAAFRAGLDGANDNRSLTTDGLEDRQRRGEFLDEVKDLIRALEERCASPLENLSRELSLNNPAQDLIQSLEQKLGRRLENLSRELSLNNPAQDLRSLEEKLSEGLRIVREELAATGKRVSEHLPLHIESPALSTVNPEAALMNHLFAFLPQGTAIDVGANRGEVSQALLDTGYKVYAFEPSPEVFAELHTRFDKRKDCCLCELAVGASDTTMELHIAEDVSVEKKYGNTSLFSTLVPHSMPPDLEFVKTVRVPVRSLASLASEGRIPDRIDLVKIDTEGFDLQVIRGMGELRPRVVVAEFWAPDFVFGGLNRLEELAGEMRDRRYLRSIVLYRIAGSDKVSFYCNYNKAVSNSWGNVFFFRDHDLFMEAFEWCSVVLPRTYLNLENAGSELHLPHRDTILPELRTRIDQLQRLIADRENDAKHLNELLKARDGELVLRQHEIAAMERLLAERDQALAQQKLEIITNTEQRLAERDEALAQQKLELMAEYDKALAQQRLELVAERNQAIAEQKLETLTYADKAARLVSQAKDLQDRLQKVERRLGKMRRSFSWKITSPLRELRRVGSIIYQMLR